MKYEAADRNVVAVATATICVAILLGTAGIPALQGAYYLDHGHFPSSSVVAEYLWDTAVGYVIGVYSDVLKLAYTISGIIEKFKVGEIVQGSTAVITAVFDVIWDAAKRLGLSLGWKFVLIWEATKLVAWL